MTDFDKTIFCEQLWSNGQWLGNHRLSIDSSGMINAVKSGGPQAGDEVLDG